MGVAVCVCAGYVRGKAAGSPSTAAGRTGQVSAGSFGGVGIVVTANVARSVGFSAGNMRSNAVTSGGGVVARCRAT